MKHFVDEGDIAFEKIFFISSVTGKTYNFQTPELCPPDRNSNVKSVFVILTENGQVKLKDILPEKYACTGLIVNTGSTIAIYTVFLMDGKFWLLDPYTGRIGYDGKKYHGYEITPFVEQYAIME